MQRSVVAPFLLISFLLSLPVAALSATDKPNVIVMMVDNLGWGELGVYGGGELVPQGRCPRRRIRKEETRRTG